MTWDFEAFKLEMRPVLSSAERFLLGSEQFPRFRYVTIELNGVRIMS